MINLFLLDLSDCRIKFVAMQLTALRSVKWRVLKLR